MNIGFVDLFVTTGADGSVAAVFPGGITVEGATPIPTILPTLLSHAASWTRGPGGAVLGQLVGAYNDDPPFNTQEMILSAVSENGAGSASIDLQADDTGGGSIILGIPGAGAKTLLDNAGQSSFLQWVQAFAVVGPWNGAVHNFFLNMPLPRALVIGSVTGWTNTAATGIGATMFVNGAAMDGGACPAGAPVNAHTPLSLMVGVTSLPAGANTFQFLTTAGAPGSDGGDIGRFIVIG